MATNAGNPATVVCNACFTVISRGPDSSFDIGGQDYCFNCLKSSMDGLINSQFGYPCLVNGITIDPGMFSATLFGGQEAFEKYKNRFDMKKREWQTPGGLRLYCNCPVGMFLGARESLQNRSETTFAGCGSCLKVWCMKCVTPTDESAASIRAYLH